MINYLTQYIKTTIVGETETEYNRYQQKETLASAMVLNLATHHKVVPIFRVAYKATSIL